MSQAASQAAAFYRDVAASKVVWTIEDAGGYPAPRTENGRRAMPFWSSRSRAERIIHSVAAYAGFHAVHFKWDEFVREWVPELKNRGQLVGVNWTGQFATGYDIEPDQLVANVQQRILRGGKVLAFRPPSAS